MFLVIPIILFVFFAIWRIPQQGAGSSQGPNNFWGYKFTFSSGFVVTILTLVLLALGERILYDLARNFAGSDYDYFDNLNTILIHSVFVIPLFALSIFLNVYMGERRQKYAIALAPYLVMGIILALQLSLQISVYFYNHHTKPEFYIVMSLLTLVSSASIYIIQSRWQPE